VQKLLLIPGQAGFIGQHFDRRKYQGRYQ